MSTKVTKSQVHKEGTLKASSITYLETLSTFNFLLSTRKTGVLPC